MSPKAPPAGAQRGSKRKWQPTNHARNPKRAKINDARTIAKQTNDAAFSNGELNVDQFVKAREYEIKALEEGLRTSKNARTTRAHQDLPNELRRRTASHNVKRVPTRLRKRLGREVSKLLRELVFIQADGC
jgi:ribonuclease P/MRP protein subunit POP1